MDTSYGFGQAVEIRVAALSRAAGGNMESVAGTSQSNAEDVTSSGLGHVILASSAGTLIEWYDFYLYAILTVVLSGQFFPGSLATGFLFSLGALWAGFAVRPFGAAFFGHVGDLVGRKNTFLVTLSVMGLSTFAVGLLPTYKSIGLAAPMLLVALRCLQGLALGGEYGGAATYVAEHAPDHQRGLYTSFIQTTATLGLFAALLIVLITRIKLGDAAFQAWGWRIPFLLSLVLVIFSLWIRLRLKESPLFARLKREGRSSSSPIRDIGRKNWKLILAGAFWRNGRPGCRLVHRTVLRSHLPDQDTWGELQRRIRDHCHCPGRRHPILCPIRLAL